MTNIDFEYLYRSIDENNINYFKYLYNNYYNSVNNKDVLLDLKDLLIYSVYHNKIEFVKFLLQDKRIDPTTTENFALFYSVNYGFIEIVDLLINDDRIDPTINDNFNICLALEKNHIEIFKLIYNYIVNNFSENISSKLSKNILLYLISIAISKKLNDIIRLLLSNNYIYNIVDDKIKNKYLPNYKPKKLEYD
jgi:hypothetical protein